MCITSSPIGMHKNTQTTMCLCYATYLLTFRQQSVDLLHSYDQGRHCTLVLRIIYIHQTLNKHSHRQMLLKTLWLKAVFLCKVISLSMAWHAQYSVNTDRFDNIVMCMCNLQCKGKLKYK